jgi:hypothetical protein
LHHHAILFRDIPSEARFEFHARFVRYLSVTMLGVCGNSVM